MTPITERNRQNAKASTGPKTEEGKAISSQNRLSHGFYAKTAISPNEKTEEYTAHLDGFIADLNPEGPVQIELVVMISDNAWLLRRARSFVATQGRIVSHYLARFAEQPESAMLEAVIKQTRLLDTFSRHVQRFQNAMLKGIKDLQALQAAVHKEQIRQAEIQPEPAPGFVPASQFSTATATGDKPLSNPEIQQKTARSTTKEEQKQAA